MFRFNEKYKFAYTTNLDINYFKYKLYNYDELQANTIIEVFIGN